MTTLKHYLQECSLSTLLEGDDGLLIEIGQKIAKDCQFFLHNSGGLPLYRAIKPTLVMNHSMPLAIRKNRKPLDSMYATHSFVNFLFEKAFNIDRIRSTCLFATGSEGISRVYGRAYFIFPIGKFTTVWSKTFKDMTSDFQSKLLENQYTEIEFSALLSKIANPLGANGADLFLHPPNATIKTRFKKVFNQSYDDFVNDKVEIIKRAFQVDTSGVDLPDAIESWNEIMIVDCDQYYRVNVLMIENIHKQLTGGPIENAYSWFLDTYCAR